MFPELHFLPRDRVDKRNRVKQPKDEEKGPGTHHRTHRSIPDGHKWACITKLLSLAWEQMAELHSHTPNH